MGRDLERYLEGRPVEARPTQYTSALTARVASHIEHIQDWLRLKLIYPHEAGTLRAAYRGWNGATTTGLANRACCRTRRSRSTSARSC